MSVVIKDQARNLRVIAARRDTGFRSLSSSEEKKRGERKFSVILVAVACLLTVPGIGYINRQSRVLNLLEKKNRGLAEKITQLKEGINGFKGIITLALEENRALRTEIDKLIKERNTMMKTLQEGRKQIATLKKKIDEMESRLDKVKAPAISSSVQPKVMQTAAVSSRVPPSDARVVFVDETYDFVVVNKGSDELLRIGDILGVYDKGNLVAVLKVVNLRKHFSACDVIERKVPFVPQGAEVRKL